VSANLNNLAALYSVQMQYSQARSLFKRALEIWVNTLGSKHPDVAIGLENLAQLQRITRQDKVAESLDGRVTGETCGRNTGDATINSFAQYMISRKSWWMN